MKDLLEPQFVLTAQRKSATLSHLQVSIKQSNDFRIQTIKTSQKVFEYLQIFNLPEERRKGVKRGGDTHPKQHITINYKTNTVMNYKESL